MFVIRIMFGYNIVNINSTPIVDIYSVSGIGKNNDFNCITYRDLLNDYLEADERIRRG